MEGNAEGVLRSNEADSRNPGKPVAEKICVLKRKKMKITSVFDFILLFNFMEELVKLDADDFCPDDPAAQAALENFGIKYLFPWQRLVVGNIMDSYFSAKRRGDEEGLLDCDGKQIVLLPTGAGKSLCFQIPAILMEGPTLVIYPLLALMSDQYRRMSEGGIKAAIFRGGQTAEERDENFRLLDGGAKIIIANPEILSDEKLTERLKEYGISHIAIDEAHCVSEWGDTFRPAYLELGKILRTLDVPVVTAFTATASPEVLARISDVLFNGEAHIVRSESDRPNIHYYVKKVASKKAAALVLAKTEARPMIIFCGTRSRTEDMAQELNTAFGAETAKFYHAGMERGEKTKIEEWFFSRKDAVLCATCAYGMGVDKKDIHTVVHLDPPQTAEAYIQEAGRGGRAAYLELGKILRTLDVPVVTAFTATASPEVLARISDVLFNGEAHIVRSESDRPNIHYYVKKVASKKAAALVLAKTEARPMIIFCGTRSRTEDMAQELNTAFGAETAKFYHAGMERGEKTKIEEWFFSRKDAVLCATCAYGMGVDKKDIHTVVHLDPPQTAEAYIQEAGRGGRDGSVANAILLWNFEDSLRFAEFPSGSRKAALREFAGTKSCRRQVLLDALGAEQAVCSGCDICRGKALLKTDSYRDEKNSGSKTSGKKSMQFSEADGISSRFHENFPVRIKIAQKISDFHKVSSRHFVEKDMPSGNVADDEEIAFRLIELSEKYFTRESFEKFYTKFMNRITIPFTGVNIWNHENFCLVMESLLSSKKIEICGWPWKGRLKIREKPENHDKKDNKRRFSRKIRFFRIPRIAFFIFRRKICRLRRRIEKMTPNFLSAP